MNDENLIQNQQKTERSPSEARENGKKGGERSGVVRRENKVLQQWLDRKDSSGCPYRDRVVLEKIKTAIGTCWDVDISDLPKAVQASIELRRKKVQMESATEILQGTGELTPEQILNINAPRKDANDLLEFLGNGGRL